MNFKKLFNFSVAVLTCSLATAMTANAKSLSEAEIGNKFRQLSGNTANVTAVEPSPIVGIYQVVADGRVFYVSEDGEYMLGGGQLFKFDSTFTNLTEARLGKERADALHADKAGYIEHKAPNEKYVVYVFSDPSCGYCSKLHAQTDEYNKLGITLRTLAFPRGGQRSPAYNVTQGIWCSNDKPKAVLNGMKTPAVQSCNGSPVDRHYALGEKLGVRGTPALFFPDGTHLKGYRPPNELLKELENHSRKG